MQPHNHYQQPYPPAYAPPPYGYAYAKPHKGTSVESLTIPLVSVFAVIAVTSGGAWWAGGQFTTLNVAIERLTEKIGTLSAPIHERISRVEQQVSSANSSRWTKTDHVLWCAKTEQQNKGWRCAEPPTAPQDMPPIWATETTGERR